MDYELIIKNGTVVDGTGAAGYRADIGVKDGRIAFIGDIKGAAAERVIDAEGKTVLEIVLEGEEVVSVEGSVFHLAEGRFLIYPGSAETKRGVAYTLPSYAKTVRFVF